MEDARPRRVALIKGACNYDHLRCFIDAMKMAFEDEGCVAVEVDLAKGADPQLIAALSRFAPDLVLCFNLDGASLRAPDGGPLGGTALTSWLVDEPYYQAQWAAALRAPHVRTVWTRRSRSRGGRCLGCAAPIATSTCSSPGASRIPSRWPRPGRSRSGRASRS